MNSSATDCSGECTVLDRAEFARIIRKARKVGITVFPSSPYDRDIVRGCAPACFTVNVPSQQAIEKLNVGEFDAHVWEVDQYGPSISWEVAPAWIQIARRREFVASRIARNESRLAMAIRGDRIDVMVREASEGQLARDRAEIPTLDAKLAALRGKKAAA